MNNPSPIDEIRTATEKHLNANRPILATLFGIRGWLLAAILLTLITPVLENRSGVVLAGNVEVNTLTGWDTIYIASALVNSDNGGQMKIWALNPFAITVYAIAGYFGYCFFVSRRISPKFALYGAGLMFAAAASQPLTHVFAAKLFLPRFTGVWRAQGLGWGWWLSTAATLAFWLSTWADQLQPLSEVPSETEPSANS